MFFRPLFNQSDSEAPTWPFPRVMEGVNGGLEKKFWPKSEL